MHRFETQAELDRLAAAVGPRYGPMILFAAATGLRPGEWIALEHRDIDRSNRLVHVRRAFRVNRLKTTKADTPRAVPLQRSALDAHDQLPSPPSATSLLFPAPRRRLPRPAQLAAAPQVPRATRRRHHPDPPPLRSAPHVRHRRAARRTRPYELSRYMGTSLINIDRTYGHLARDTHRHAIQLLDDYNSGCRDVRAGGRSVDVGPIATPISATSEAA